MRKAILLYTIFLFSTGYSQVWTPKADFGGSPRKQGVAFVIGERGFYGTGEELFAFTSDFWRYNVQSDSWNQIATFPANARDGAIGFSIGDKGYVGTGNGSGYQDDFWEYDTTDNMWTQKNDFPGGPIGNAAYFVIDSLAYVGTGTNSVEHTEFWSYNPSTDGWTSIAPFPYSTCMATGFSIGSKGYVVTYSSTNNFFEYDPGTNMWTPKPDFPGTPRYLAASFTIGLSAFFGTGAASLGGTELVDFWEYNQYNNSWIQREDIPDSVRRGASGFTINGKGYVVNGGIKSPDFVYFQNVYEYSPSQGTGLSENLFDKVSINIYPNPFFENFTIQTKDVLKNGQFDLFDLTGKLVRSIPDINGNHLTIQRNNLSAGMYFYTLTQNGTTIDNGKIIVE